MRLSVVIPARNEAAALPALLADLAPLRAAGGEVIVVDGGSVDGTPGLARSGADRVLTADGGRAGQMAAGAAAARGDLLWFLHADTRLPEGAEAVLRSAVAAGRRWGRFDVCLSGRRPIFRVIAALMNRRSCLTGIATGDQGIFVTRAALTAVGGWPALPLMEDIELSRRLRRRAGWPACLRPALITSSRRWEEGGVARTILLMWGLRLAFFLGVPARVLARWYR
jgi:rSAM/selenodomain-associated transferase 2